MNRNVCVGTLQFVIFVCCLIVASCNSIFFALIELLLIAPCCTCISVVAGKAEIRMRT